MIYDIFGKLRVEKENKKKAEMEIIKKQLLFESSVYVERRNIYNRDIIIKLAEECEFYEITLQIIDESDFLTMKEIDWVYYGFNRDEYLDYIMELVKEKYEKRKR